MINFTVPPFHCSTAKADFHIHSDFSADSRIKLAELLPHAISLGYESIAITEHLDLLPQEVSIFGIPPLLKYQARILQLRNQFPQIQLIFGIEVGDYQRVKEYADTLLNSVKFDLVLGSVHFVDNHINVAIPLKEPLSKAQISEYYEQNLMLVETCDINVLAHLGVYKRFYQTAPDETHVLHLIEKIFDVIIKRGIALELNYSAYRRVFHDLHPEPKYLDLYKKSGGRLVTIGSDSHKLDQFDDYYHFAATAVEQFGFQYLLLNP
jgi:histidinol-phosphatase (PHP family)